MLHKTKFWSEYIGFINVLSPTPQKFEQYLQKESILVVS